MQEIYRQSGRGWCSNVGWAASQSWSHPLYGCCLQCCTGHVCKDVCIKGSQCIPSHASNAQRNMWARPAVATIKFKRDAVNTEIGANLQKKHKKKILKLQRRTMELLFIIMKWDRLYILRIHKLLQNSRRKANWKRLIILIEGQR